MGASSLSYPEDTVSHQVSWSSAFYNFSFPKFVISRWGEFLCSKFSADVPTGAKIQILLSNLVDGCDTYYVTDFLAIKW